MRKLIQLSLAALLCLGLFTQCKKENQQGTMTFKVVSESENPNATSLSNLFLYEPIEGAEVGLSNSLQEAMSRTFYTSVKTDASGTCSISDVKYGSVYYSVIVDNDRADFGYTTVIDFDKNTSTVETTVPYE